ncbi:MAG TPA: heme exporter protein CcmB, partial [Rhodocyclaceae bacterium]|nr:heme exporter protein CcmB [Rhodocyclaceae bacterium]
MLSIVAAVIARDLRLAMRRQADIVSALFFFIIVVSLFPLGVGPEPDLLRKLAPGVLWVAALLATMLSLPRLFADDLRESDLAPQRHLGGC